MAGGRPSKIDQVVAQTGGRNVTAGERIVEIVSIGGYFEEACAAAGVTRETGYEWLRRGADAHARQARNPSVRLTAHEVRCMEFSDAKARGEAEWEAQALASLEQAARGGRKLTTTTTKSRAVGDGQVVVETTTRVEEQAPDVRVTMWRLERRFPDRYARRLEVTGQDGAPLLTLDERAASLAEHAAEYAENVTPIDQGKRTRKAPAKRKAATS